MPSDEVKPSETLCELCGEPMPKGEEMFKYHGYSGPCPKPFKSAPPVPAGAAPPRKIHFLDGPRDKQILFDDPPSAQPPSPTPGAREWLESLGYTNPAKGDPPWMNAGFTDVAHLLQAYALAYSREREQRIAEWRRQLLAAWAADNRSLMTALLEGGPAALRALKEKP